MVQLALEKLLPLMPMSIYLLVSVPSGVVATMSELTKLPTVLMFCMLICT